MFNNCVHKSPACIVGIGEILWDLLPTGKLLGGAPGNVAAMAAQLGLHGMVVSAVGDDPYGREILGELDRNNVDRSGIRSLKELTTGVVDVTLDSAGVPSFSIRQPAAWDAILFDDALDRVARSADAVVFGTLAQRDPRSRAGITEFLRAVRPDCLKVCDVNFRPPFVSESIIIDSLKLADVVKLNDTELPTMAKMLGMAGEVPTQLRELRARFDLDLVVYTMGDKGSRMITSNYEGSHTGFKTQVVDTVGAGDSFIAVVTVGLLLGLDLDRIQDLANRVAAFVCTQAGGTPPLPTAMVAAFKQ
jgi:fructokinase